MVRSCFPRIGSVPSFLLLLLLLLAHGPAVRAQLVWEQERPPAPPPPVDPAEAQFNADANAPATIVHAIAPPPPPPVTTSLTWELDERPNTFPVPVAEFQVSVASGPPTGVTLASRLLWETDEELPMELNEQLLALDVMPVSEPSNPSQVPASTPSQDAPDLTPGPISLDHSPSSELALSVNLAFANSTQFNGYPDGTGMAGILRVTWGQRSQARPVWTW